MFVRLGMSKSALLRRDPGERAIDYAEHMGACAWQRGHRIFQGDHPLLMPAEARSRGDHESVIAECLCGKNEILIQVNAAKGVRIPAGRGVRRGFCQRFKTQRRVLVHGTGWLTLTKACVIE